MPVNIVQALIACSSDPLCDVTHTRAKSRHYRELLVEATDLQIDKQ
jgi:hypothetical protein